MLVKDVLSAIERKELSVKQLTEQYNVSDRTIQNKIKKAGFKWHPSKAVYEFIGDDESVLEKSFDSLFNSPKSSSSTNKSKDTSKTQSKSNSSSKSRSESKSNNASVIESRSDVALTFESPEQELGSKVNLLPEKTPANQDTAEFDAKDQDIIDILLSGKKANSKRQYRGFYFDKDVLDIVDRAGNKSELINQALRKVFKDKGLL